MPGLRATRPRSVGIVAVQVLALAVVGSLGASGRVRTAREIATDPPGGALNPVTHNEPTVAIDPLSSSHLVALYQQDRWTEEKVEGWPSRRTIGVATSRDGGRRWTSGSLPALTTVTGGPFERATDSVVTFGPDGAVYALTLAYDRVRGCRSAITVQRSDDGGGSFGVPSLVQDATACPLLGGAFVNDKGWITADTFARSPHSGRLYVVWTREDLSTVSTPIVLRFSDDRAVTWSDTVTVSSTSLLAGGFAPVPLVQPNGDLTVVYFDFHPESAKPHVVAQTSHDGGLAFDAPVEIADDQSLEVPGIRSGRLIGAAIDPVRGDLYVVWQDGRLRDDGRNDIVLSRSTDGGAHWAEPRRVNGDALKERNHFTPAVAAYDGVVVVTFTTRDGDAPWLQTRATVSPDGGTTFGNARRLGPRGDVRFAQMDILLTQLPTLGDYTGLASDADGAHAVWIRPGRPRGHGRAPHQTPWTARIDTARPYRP